MTGAQIERSILVLLRRLASKGAGVRRKGGSFELIGASRVGRTPVRFPADSVLNLIARDLIVPELGNRDRFVLSDAGRALVRRFVSGGEDFARQHQCREEVLIDDPGYGIRSATINVGESPLAWLRRRKGLDGRPMISAEEFAAGERLRIDFTRGQLMPRVTANWTAAVASARRADAGGSVDLAEVAMEARRRVDRALKTVGPEFGGLLVDFCCFLKGLEQIEHDRAWPARSAKVVLRLALTALARHYGISYSARGASGGPIRHWGSDDYRPTID